MARTNRVQTMLDDETLEKVKAAAQADNRSVSDFIRVLIEVYLREQ